MSFNMFSLYEFQPNDVFSRKFYIYKLNFSGQSSAKIFAESPRIHSDIRNRSSFFFIFKCRASIFIRYCLCDLSKHLAFRPCVFSEL